jgi:1-pyrroline-5-carboxylate dehydrogenase
MKTIMTNQLRIDTPLKFETFTSAVIDRNSFNRIKAYIDYARSSSSTTKIVVGGEYDDSVGFYIQPTLIETTDPKDKLMREEIFGPVVTVYVYDDKKYNETVDLVNQTSNYALTGSIFCQDKTVLNQTRERLINAAGNIYLNDKSTGSIVNQQPFGGARLSGTNDKAGGPHYLFRFSSPLAIKNMKQPLKTFKHVSME